MNQRRRLLRRPGATCIDKYEASVWETTDAGLIGRIRLDIVSLAELTAKAVQRGPTSNDYGVAGCQLMSVAALSTRFQQRAARRGHQRRKTLKPLQQVQPQSRGASARRAAERADGEELAAGGINSA